MISNINRIFKLSNNIDSFKENLNVDDSTYVSCYDKSKMYLISLNKLVKDICDKINYVEISDYSPVIKSSVKLNNMFEIYKKIPDRNRSFTIIFDILNNKIFVNNYLFKDEFIQID